LFAVEHEKLESGLFRGVGKVIQTLAKDYRLILVSTNDLSNVKNNLEKHGLGRYFSELFCSDLKGAGIRGDKAIAIMQVLERDKLHEKEVILIGDKAADFKEGKKAGLSQVLLVEYGWGYKPDSIPEYERRYIVRNPKQLIQVIRKIESATMSRPKALALRTKHLFGRVPLIRKRR